MSTKINCSKMMDSVKIDPRIVADEVGMDEDDVLAEMGRTFKLETIEIDDEHGRLRAWVTFSSRAWGEVIVDLLSVEGLSRDLAMERVRLANRIMIDARQGDFRRNTIAMLVEWLAGGGYDAENLAHAVREPWHYEDELQMMLSEWIIAESMKDYLSRQTEGRL